GSEAIHSNLALWKLVQAALTQAGLPATAVQLVQTTDRAAVGQLITMPQYVDVIIPRGGKGLIERITAEARVPVIKHLDGNCHTYVDSEVDLGLAVTVTDNAKTQKYSPCNATESLLVHVKQAESFLPKIGAVFAAKGVEMRADLRAKSRSEARVPVIKHLDGNCHTYVDSEVDLGLAVTVTDNAKTQKYSPCNATESLLVHVKQAESFLPKIGAVFAAKGVEMRADLRAKS